MAIFCLFQAMEIDGEALQKLYESYGSQTENNLVNFVATLCNSTEMHKQRLYRYVVTHANAKFTWYMTNQQYTQQLCKNATIVIHAVS